jgi:hypothetical protein
MRIAWRSPGLLALVCTLACATVAAAQATTPPPGEGSVSVTYQNYAHTGHFDKNGNKNTNGATQSQVFITSLDLGLPRDFGLYVSLPVMASRYTGPSEYFVETIRTTPGPLDDGTYHRFAQDLRIETRRMFVVPGAAVAPFVAVTIPTYNYETKGEAVPGRHRTELQFGAMAYVPLDRVIPDTHLEGRYAYATLEHINGYPHTRSNIEIEVEHELTKRLVANVQLAWQVAHTGPGALQLVNDWANHDRFINSSFFNVAGGGSFRLNRSTELYAAYAGTVRGKRGAHVARVFVFGVTRSFGAGFKGLGGG